MAVLLGAINSDDFFKITKISNLKKGDFFRRKGGKKVYVYDGKERAYNSSGKFVGWGFAFTDFNDSSNFYVSKKDILVESGFTF